MERKKKVWFVTGASKGLGLALVKRLLEEGQKVAATSRNKADLKKAVGDTEGEFLPLEMDLMDEAAVNDSIFKALSHFGKIDVIVNNAGYGLTGAVEELSDQEARKNFDVNVFGSLNVLRAVLPTLRQQGYGRIFNISSIGGFTGAFPGFGIYCATKFAVNGFSESLAEEVRPFGIHTTIVSPGYFRTSFLANSLNVPQNPIAEYKNVRESEAVHEGQYNGNQPGDPVKAANVMMAVADMDNPPMHLFLGEDAYALAEAKIKMMGSEMESVRALATATNFAD